jgi:hypothetical protein
VLLILVITLRNFAIRWINLHGHVSIGHDRVITDRWIFGIHQLIFLLNVNRFPLPCTGKASFSFHSCQLKVLVSIAVTVALARHMADGVKHQDILVIHGQSLKGHTNIFSCFESIGFTIHTFRLNLD